MIPGVGKEPVQGTASFSFGKFRGVGDTEVSTTVQFTARISGYDKAAAHVSPLVYSIWLANRGFHHKLYIFANKQGNVRYILCTLYTTVLD